MSVLKNLCPERVFYYFEKICSIPHGSGNTKEISDFCMEFAKQHGLSADQDSLNNVIIRKPASQGREDHPTVILQGHLDMVCEKQLSCDFDFSKEGLRLAVDGDFVYAKETTLGADDGIAIAMTLAVLEDKSLEHPPIEALFTVDEETGMYGAEAVDASKLKGQTLLNIDSAQEGILTAGCAGGARADLSLDLTPTSITMPCYKIVISGLIGGHSGSCINSGRLNANKLMAKFLNMISSPYCLVDVAGGQRDNVIPSESVCVVSTDADVESLVEKFVRGNVLSTDAGLSVTVCPAEKEMIGYDSYSSKIAVSFLNELPCGVVKMSDEVQNLVETSLNLGVLKIEKDRLVATVSVRSSVTVEKEKLLNRLSSIVEKYGGSCLTKGFYPAWEFRKNSDLRDTMVSVYHTLYGKQPSVVAIHAGLECGLLSGKIKDMDAVSFGPNIHEIHTVRERLSISSTERTYKYLCEILKEL